MLVLAQHYCQVRRRLGRCDHVRIISILSSSSILDRYVATLHTRDDSLVPGEQVGEGGVGVIKHEVILGSGQALKVDGGGARWYREVRRR